MNMLKEKVWPIALLLLSAWSTAAAEHVTYFHNDGLGSPVAATNDQGEVLWTEAYDPYGTRLVKPAAPNRLWYTGKSEESEFGLTYFGARWYEPGIGRFHGIDPKEVEPGDIHSFNRYAYGNDNPYTYVDPDGRFSIPAVLLTAVSVGVLLTHSEYAWAPGLSDSPAPLPASAHVAAVVDAALPLALMRRLVVTPAAETVGGRTVAKNGAEGVTKRPSGFRKRTVQDAWDDAADGGAAGSKACPTCGKQADVAPGQGPRDWDVDHQPKWKDRDLRGMDRKQVLDEYNKDVRLRCPSCNRSDN